MHSNNRPNPFVNREPLKTGGREVFLARVRKALQHDPAQNAPPPSPPEPPARDESVLRQVPTTATRQQLTDRWIERATANTMRVHRIANAEGDLSPGTLHAALDACLANEKVTRCILNAHGSEQRFDLPGYLARRNIQPLRWGDPHCREDSFHCEASITDCRVALADSGSLLVWSDAGFGRSSTLVIPIHIVLLPASRILPDMIDALAFAQAESRDPQGRLPSNIVLINGPSKTADIEMNLITGVHGPKTLQILVLENQ